MLHQFKAGNGFPTMGMSVLRDYAIWGYVIDKKRMENAAFFGEDYFERLLAGIREIVLSERRFYQKITGIYATAMDYNKDAAITKEFFAKAQNKLHCAAHGHTSAELIYQAPMLNNHCYETVFIFFSRFFAVATSNVTRKSFGFNKQ